MTTPIAALRSGVSLLAGRLLTARFLTCGIIHNADLLEF